MSRSLPREGPLQGTGMRTVSELKGQLVAEGAWQWAFAGQGAREEQGAEGTPDFH